jgi:hypothetical protein
MLTLRNIKNLAFAQADMLNSDFITDGECKVYINMEIAKLYDLLINEYEDQVIKYPCPFIHVESGKEDYGLPQDFYKLRAAFEVEGGNDRGRRKKLNPMTLSNIQDYQLPSTNYEVELWMIPKYTPLYNDDDRLEWLESFMLPAGWEQFIIAGAAASMLIKEESDPTGALALKQEARMQIIDSAPEKDLGEARQIREVGREMREEVGGIALPTRTARLVYCLVGKTILFREVKRGAY